MCVDNNSVTIQPFVLIFPSNATIKRDSLVIISNDFKHDAYAVQHFMTVLRSNLQSFIPKSYRCYYVVWWLCSSIQEQAANDGESAVVKGKLDWLIRAQHLMINDVFDVFKLLRDSGDVEIQSGHLKRHVLCPSLWNW